MENDVKKISSILEDLTKLKNMFHDLNENLKKEGIKIKREKNIDKILDK